MDIHAQTPVTELKGVGKARAEQLERVGIRTVSDLLSYYPRAYERRGDVHLLAESENGSTASVILTVASEVRNAKIHKDLTIQKFRAFDDSGSCEVVYFNSPYVKDVFHVGCVFRFYGKIGYTKQRTMQVLSPKYEPIIEGKTLADLLPIYPLTAGLTSGYLSKLIRSVMENNVISISDPLPEKTRTENSLCTLSYAVKNAHFPESDDALNRAMRRLAFDEMLTFALGIALSCQRKSVGDGMRISPCNIHPLLEKLPYELTQGQKAAFNDIYRDMVIGDVNKCVHPMARILVGDVGSGKTIVAVMAMYIAAKSGKQAALMVPTEILAQQHYQDICDLFLSLGIRTELLTGATPLKEKKRIYASLADKTAQVVIGTHALLSDKVEFGDLALVITDEQHRFGVAQRAVLKEKSGSLPAHLLVMSATPIPRTLALTMYGDLDVSRITEMPKGRMRVDTCVVDESYRRQIHSFVEKQIALGGQCYIVCPSIEANEESEATTEANGGGSVNDLILPGVKYAEEGEVPALKNAVEYAEEFKRIHPSLSVGLLHGRMKGEEKDRIMAAFAKGEIQVLVSTTVIEVGVNVPNATLMIVENAERFGLSQLHQLRGRVGRGQKKSYCILVSDLKTEKAQARLDVMRTTYDGYEIAEKDLILRGPGDFFASQYGDNLRQSGGFDFHFASMCNDAALADTAFSAAKAIIADDPKLEKEENALLKESVRSAFETDLSYIS